VRRIRISTFLFAVLLMVSHRALGATATCDLSATTANFSSQLAAAAPGQTVCLATGNYGGFAGVSKSSPGVTITPAVGATVTMSLAWNHASPTTQWLILDGIQHVKGGDIAGPTNNVTIKNSTITDKMNIWGGGSSNACSNCPSMNNNNIVFDTDLFNMADNAGGLNGFEGRLNILGNSLPNGVTVKNSKFTSNCADGIQFDSGGNGVTIGPGNEFVGLVQGSCGQHVDSIQFVTTSTPGPVITGNYFHDNSTGIVGFDGSIDAVITNNVIQNLTQDYITVGNVPSTTVFSHNTLGGPIFCSNNHDGGSCRAQIMNNIADTIGIGSGSSGTFIPSFNGNNFCTNGGCAGSNTINSGSPTFVAGSNPSTYAGFALTSGSVGHNAGNDGKDIGINVTASSPAPPTATRPDPPTNLQAIVQ
jgi:hypothetical protein